ncbi:UNVERIFIED_CONTAM: hypothetical protein K2H54_002271, partial [Gekko kuhli]
MQALRDPHPPGTVTCTPASTSQQPSKRDPPQRPSKESPSGRTLQALDGTLCRRWLAAPQVRPGR